MILTYKYRLKGKRAVRQLRRCAWAINQIWNFCVATQHETQRRWRSGSKATWPSHFDLARLTKGTSVDLKINSKSINSVCAQFTRSRDQRRRCPKFRRSSGSKRSLGWIPFQQQSRQIESNSITYLGNTYRFFGAKQRPLPAEVKGGAFVEDARGHWFVCFRVEVADDRATGSGQIGIDLGLKSLATLSDGGVISNTRPFVVYAQKLASAQRAGKRTRIKALYAKISDVRRDHLHKASARLTRENRLIVVGDVSSSKLAKTRMSKSVLDAGWSTFRSMLRYKASRHGATFLEVDERFTSQTCSTCGMLPSSRPRGIAGLGIREWVCSSCGANHDRDVNAAKNILKLGLSAQPREDGSQVVYGR